MAAALRAGLSPGRPSCQATSSATPPGSRTRACTTDSTPPYLLSRALPDHVLGVRSFVECIQNQDQMPARYAVLFPALIQMVQQLAEAAKSPTLSGFGGTAFDRDSQPLRHIPKQGHAFGPHRNGIAAQEEHHIGVLPAGVILSLLQQVFRLPCQKSVLPAPANPTSTKQFTKRRLVLSAPQLPGSGTRRKAPNWCSRSFSAR